jgi:hypothetical protein
LQLILYPLHCAIDFRWRFHGDFFTGITALQLRRCHISVRHESWQRRECCRPACKATVVMMMCALLPCWMHHRSGQRRLARLLDLSHLFVNAFQCLEELQTTLATKNEQGKHNNKDALYLHRKFSHRCTGISYLQYLRSYGSCICHHTPEPSPRTERKPHITIVAFYCCIDLQQV